MKQNLSIKKSILFFIFCLTLLSCGGADTAAPGGAGNFGGSGAKFKGSYSGTYVGTTTGSWTLNIDANGVISGSVMTSSDTIILSGSVNSSGNITVSGDSPTKFTFTLAIDSSGNITGTWEDSIGGSGTVSTPLTTATGNLELIGSDLSFGTKTFSINEAEIKMTGTNTNISLKNKPAATITNLDSMIMVVSYDTSGKLILLSFRFFNVNIPLNIFSYDLQCIVASSECVKIQLDASTKSIIFTDSIFTVTSNTAGNINSAVGTLKVTGTASWN